MPGKTLITSALLTVLSFIFLGSCVAETVSSSTDLPNNKKTFAYIVSQPMLETISRLGVEQDRQLGLQLDCKSQYSVKPIVSVVVSPIEFPDDKQNPTKGIWIIRYQLDRCGDSKTYNAAFIASNNGDTPTPKPYFPGSTLAGVILVRDAMPQAVAGAVVKSGLKDCKDINVFDMQVTEKPHDVVEGDKTSKNVWNELWTIKICGQSVDMPVTFIPDADGGGTSFSFSLGVVNPKK